jgi:outer membrane protein OmpA-like peptidoglycan-associated protein
MNKKLLLSASVAALLLACMNSGPLGISNAWAQSSENEESAEEPPIPIEKLRKRQRERRSERSENREERREDRTERREEQVEEREENRAERRNERQENRAEQQEERRGDRAEQRREGGNENRAGRREERGGERREERVEEREERGEERREERVEEREERGEERREDRAEEREERGEERREDRAEEREERGEDRAERRERSRGQDEQPEATVSRDAEKPRNLRRQSVEEKVEQAEEEQISVVPDRITDDQRRRLREAERRRREEARRDRDKLLGAAAVGAIIGAVIPSLGGTIAADEGDRIVVRRDGRLIVRKDESALFRDRDSNIRYERMRNGLTREIVTRRNGVQIISVKDEGGNVIRRVRVDRNGNRTVLFNSREDDRDARRRPLRDMPRYRVDIPQDRYIVSGRRGDRHLFRETFMAEPVYESEERYSLQEIRYNEEVRGMVRRVDLDTITFDTGSAYVSESQIVLLGDIAGSMLDVIDERPDTVFLIEGHTDATGPDITNLTLSDRRAESVARILVEAYGVPPENLVTQGYGEQFLKVPTEFAERANRRATVRNITPILEAYAE